MVESWQEVATVRADVYRLLGSCLLEPVFTDRAALLTPGFWRGFPLEPANGVMASALNQIDGVTARLSALPRDEALQLVQTEYMVLFLGAGEPLAPPWESLYRTPEKLLFGPPAGKVRAFMERFGVEAVAKYRMPEDHMGLELMLLAAASEDSVRKGREDWQNSARIQAEFIAAHPLAWIGDFQRDAADHATAGFYAAVIGLIHGVLLWDRELLDEYLAAP